ncbi:MAG: hypothetical protein R2880_19175 [Deinococcales bacterium]
MMLALPGAVQYFLAQTGLSFSRHGLEMSKTNMMIESNQAIARENREHQTKLELTRACIQYIMHQDRLEIEKQKAKDDRDFQAIQRELERAFQEEQRGLDRETQEKLAKFIQEQENLRLKSRFDFETSLEKQRQQLQYELQRLNHEFQLNLANQQAKLYRDNREYDEVLKKHPLYVQASSLHNEYENLQGKGAMIPPLVLFIPPLLDGEKEVSFYKFPNLSRQVEQSARDFFNHIYNDDGQR